jgi:hypothetical protein
VAAGTPEVEVVVVVAILAVEAAGREGVAAGQEGEAAGREVEGAGAARGDKAIAAEAT